MEKIASLAGLLALVGSAVGTAAAAQAVTPCGRDWVTQAQNITEPWEANIRSFANGEVRVAMLDTIEPAGTPFYLLVISPPRDELGTRQCRLISRAEGAGFASMDFAAMTASYAAGRGLELTMPVAVFDAASTDLPTPYRLTVTINQSTGDVTARQE